MVHINSKINSIYINHDINNINKNKSFKKIRRVTNVSEEGKIQQWEEESAEGEQSRPPSPERRLYRDPAGPAWRSLTGKRPRLEQGGFPNFWPKIGSNLRRIAIFYVPTGFSTWQPMTHPVSPRATNQEGDGGSWGFHLQSHRVASWPPALPGWPWWLSEEDRCHIFRNLQTRPTLVRKLLCIRIHR